MEAGLMYLRTSRAACAIVGSLKRPIRKPINSQTILVLPLDTVSRDYSCTMLETLSFLRALSMT